ncbi:MAG TPA: PAS domain-containing sensor histidine kinase [Minicystis sp.]|nr:PAS domain-containing sensor histidine kinase [Minicystis sp.]
MERSERLDAARTLEGELGAIAHALAFLDEAVRARGDGVFAVDRDHRVLFWSGRLEEIFGLARADVLGRSALDVLPFLRESGEGDRLAAALAGATRASDGVRFAVPETGREGVLEATCAPLRDAAGHVVGAYGLVRDVTEARRAKDELRETEGRFRAVADAAPVLLWMSGPDARRTFFNATWLAFTGRTIEEELGVGWAEGVHPEDLRACLDTYRDAFDARRRFEMDYRLRRADGAYRWLLDRGLPRHAPDGTFLGFVGSCVDITDHKRLEAELRRAVRHRDDFLSIAAHELRTPLTPLTLALHKVGREAARAGDDDGERLHHAVEAAQLHGKRLVALVEELLDISRLTGGYAIQLAPAETDLAELAADVVFRFGDAARASECSIELDAGARVVGAWDRPRLDRAVANLVSNAIKYGAGAPVRVSVRDEGEDGVLVVRDGGIGVDPADHQRIFERFERAVSTRNYGGFGVGLWIARQVVEAHGGSVVVQSEKGHGATFTLRLPKAR